MAVLRQVLLLLLVVDRAEPGRGRGGPPQPLMIKAVSGTTAAITPAGLLMRAIGPRGTLASVMGLRPLHP